MQKQPKEIKYRHLILKGMIDMTQHKDKPLSKTTRADKNNSVTFDNCTLKSPRKVYAVNIVKAISSKKIAILRNTYF